MTVDDAKFGDIIYLVFGGTHHGPYLVLQQPAAVGKLGEYLTDTGDDCVLLLSMPDLRVCKSSKDTTIILDNPS